MIKDECQASVLATLLKEELTTKIVVRIGCVMVICIAKVGGDDHTFQAEMARVFLDCWIVIQIF